MNDSEAARLDETFGLGETLRFETGPGGLPIAVIANDHARASVSTYGAHVLTYHPLDSEPVLWVSRRRYAEVGKPIRGGIPICWPWFGPHPVDGDKPAHGLARTTMWRVIEAAATDDGATRLVMSLPSSSEIRALWPHDFDLGVSVEVGAVLRVELVTRNAGREPFDVGAASAVGGRDHHGRDGPHLPRIA